MPGHTAGSVALHLPSHGVLFTGDTIAEGDGQALLGPFNVDRGQAWESLHRQEPLTSRSRASATATRSETRGERCEPQSTRSPDLARRRPA